MMLFKFTLTFAIIILVGDYALTQRYDSVQFNQDNNSIEFIDALIKKLERKLENDEDNFKILRKVINCYIAKSIEANHKREIFESLNCAEYHVQKLEKLDENNTFLYLTHIKLLRSYWQRNERTYCCEIKENFDAINLYEDEYYKYLKGECFYREVIEAKANNLILDDEMVYCFDYFYDLTKIYPNSILAYYGLMKTSYNLSCEKELIESNNKIQSFAAKNWIEASLQVQAEILIQDYDEIYCF